MCWEYEDEYGWCFDHLFFWQKELSLIMLLEEEYGVHIVDKYKFKDEVFSFLSSLHENEIIRPKEENDEKVL